MADSEPLVKLKEQYVDEILSIVPLSQAFFIILMVIVSDAIHSGNFSTALDILSVIGLKSSLGVDDGKFWQSGYSFLCAAFVLALLNIYVLRKLLSRSLRLSKVSSSLIQWQGLAATRVAGLSAEQRSVIHLSLKLEVEHRLRKFKGKRIATELLSSIFFAVTYSNIFLVIISFKQDFLIVWDWRGFAFATFFLIICIFQHRESVRYAIAKVLPLKVYASALTGELVFFEEISG